MLNTEKLVTFAEAAAVLPEIAGRRVHPSAIWRWARKGIRGVRLETRALGGRYLTSMEALDRFSAALADVPRPASSPRARDGKAVSRG